MSGQSIRLVSLDSALYAAIDAAKNAGEHLIAVQGHVTAEAKGHPTDLVTAADREAEARIRERLEALLPGIPVIGEEYGGEAPPDRPYWVVDPLDGTANWFCNLPLWCSSIALVQGGIPVVAVVHAPALGESFTAIRGLGARLNGRAIRVSESNSLNRLLIAARPSLDRSAGRAVNLEQCASLLSCALSLRGLGSSALELAWLAAGRFGGFYHHRLHPWDVAAGILLIQEAGGAVTRPDGTTGSILDPGPLLATNGLVHSRVVDMVRSVAGDARVDRNRIQ